MSYHSLVIKVFALRGGPKISKTGMCEKLCCVGGNDRRGKLKTCMDSLMIELSNGISFVSLSYSVICYTSFCTLYKIRANKKPVCKKSCPERFSRRKIKNKTLIKSSCHADHFDTKIFC